MSDRIGNGNGNGLVGADDDASSTTFSGADSSALDGKLMVGAIVALFLVILFILALHIYSRFFWRRSYSRELSRQRRRRQRLHFSGGNGQDPPPARRGLDKATIDAMPVFTYDPAMFAVHEGQNEEEEGAGVLECAVCLEEFEEGQKGRILPKCGHRFHTECIDMWFFSHSNCPLCRAPVVWSDLTSPPLVSDETGTQELTAVELASRGLLVGSSSSTSSSSVPAGGLRRQQTPQHIAIEIPSRDSGLALTSPASGRRSLRSRVPSGRFHASEIQQQQSDNDYHGGTNACSSSSTSEPLLKSSPASAPPPQTPRSFKSFKRMLSRDRKCTPAPPYPDSDAGIGPSGS